MIYLVEDSFGDRLENIWIGGRKTGCKEAVAGRLLKWFT